MQAEVGWQLYSVIFVDLESVVGTGLGQVVLEMVEVSGQLQEQGTEVDQNG